jgi:hypothetical protein
MMRVDGLCKQPVTRWEVAVMMRGEVWPWRQGDGENARMVTEEVGFGDAQLKVEDVQELAFDASHVALPEDACAESPMDVLERRVIEILRTRVWGPAVTRYRCGAETYFGSTHECAEEHPLQCPLLEGDVEMGLGPVDVDEGGEDHGCGDLCTGEDVRDKGGEGSELGLVGRWASPRGRGQSPHGIVDCVCDDFNHIL